MSEVKLGDIFLKKGVKDFGSALRKAVVWQKDYASLVEFEYVETPEEFAETLKKFLRRYKGKRPEEKSLEEVVNLVDLYGVRAVRAALIAHALVKSSKAEEEEEIEGGK
jgi:hypothetical protein